MTEVTLLPSIEINPDSPATASCIGLHGLGADGHNLASLMTVLPAKLPVRWIFPHAPKRPVSLHGGVHLRAWYDIYGLGFNSREDKTGLYVAAQSIERLIQREIDRGMPAEQITLIGFSQGGALALYTGLRYHQRLAGIMALSSYLPLAGYLAQERSPANKHTPIFVAHGEQDTVVPLEMGEWSINCLRQWGYAIEFHRYPMEHTLCLQELTDIRRWLQQRLLSV